MRARSPATRRILPFAFASCVALVVGAPRSADAHTAFVTLYAEWRYDATGKDLGTAWRAPSFDDGAWAKGEAAIGAASSSYGISFRTKLPDASLADPTRYLRATFTLGDVKAKDVGKLTLHGGWVHGFVAYLNGTEIARRSLPDAPAVIGYATPATKHVPTALEDVDLSSAAPLLVDGKNVLAIELHQTSPPTDVVLWAGALLFESTTPHLVRGPYLQLGTKGSMVVRFRTNQALPGVVRYGTTPTDLSKTATDAPTKEHTVTLTGLAPGTKYFYSVGTDALTFEGGDEAHSFVTPPSASKPLRIWVLGDSGTQDGSPRVVRDAYYAYTKDRRTDLWLMLGDNAYPSGHDDEYQFALFEGMFEPTLRTSVLWPTFGNHDWGDGVSDSTLQTGPYFDAFTLPTKGEAGGEPSGTEAYYSFDHGDVHFVCLDTQAPTEKMVDWLAADLTKNALPWTIAFFHVPPYTKGTHDSDADKNIARLAFLPLFDAHGVDLVLTGHSHVYERSILLRGQYGPSHEFTAEPAKYTVNGGDGREGSGGAYVKPAVPGPNQGTVYVVAGNSGGRGDGAIVSLDHPVMIPLKDPHTGSSLRGLMSSGSLVVDVDGPRLDARYLDFDGEVLDSFTILKGPADPKSDAGPSADASQDAGPPAPNSDDGGCGCATIGRDRTVAFDSIVVSILSAVVALRRRRFAPRAR